MNNLPCELVREVCTEFLDVRSTVKFTTTCREVFHSLVSSHLIFEEFGAKNASKVDLTKLMNKMWFVKRLSIDFEK